MVSEIRMWFFNQKNLLKMSRFIILTLLLLFITWFFDLRYPFMKSYIPKPLLLSVEVSVDFLSNISGVFLTISIFCFTIIVLCSTNTVAAYRRGCFRRLSTERELSVYTVYL